MTQQFGKVIVRKLRLIFLILLLVQMNACMVVNYHITVQEPSEKGTTVVAKYDDSMHFVIPRYSRLELRCDTGPVGSGTVWWMDLIGLALSSCQKYRDVIGVQMHEGVSMALHDTPLGKPVELREHIGSQGLVCVVTVNEQGNDDIRYGEILSAMTFLIVPAYTTHKFVLSYSVLADFKAIKEYEYHVTENAISGWVSWMLFPVMYPFWDDIKMEVVREYGKYGPHASVVSRITKTFLSEAHRDGIL